MRRVLYYPVALIVIALLPIPRADARGGGGGGGGFGVGFRGGFGGGFHGSPGFHAGNGFRGAVRRPGFVSDQRLPFVARGFQNRQVNRNGGIGAPFDGFASGLPNTVPTQ